MEKDKLDLIKKIITLVDTKEGLKKVENEVDEVLRDLQREMDQVEKRLLNEIRSLRNDLTGRVGVLEKYRWIILGGFIAVGWILSKNFKFIMSMMSGTGI